MPDVPSLTVGKKCLVPKCTHTLALGGPSVKRGLCVTCYKRAKDMVESGSTTWEKLEAMGLSKSQNDDPFTEAFNNITKEN